MSSCEAGAVDCHSHFFPNAFGPDSDPKTYIKMAESIGVSKSIISASPTPRIETKSGTRFPCLWQWDNRTKQFRYFEKTVNKEGQTILEKPAPLNPYNSINIRLLRLIQQQQNCLPELYMAYLHHPLLDTPDEVESWLRNPLVKAIKIHGISSATSPQDVQDYLPILAKKYHKPIIAHTDYSKSTANEIGKLYRANDPMSWINWALLHNVKLLITHAARLSTKSLEAINNSENFRLGCAPDKMLANEPDRLENSCTSIFDFVLPRIDPRKLIFDIDYGWNVAQRNGWQNKDWLGLDRLKRNISNYGLGIMAPTILSENANLFFRLED